MSRRPIDYEQKIKEALQHREPHAAAFECPLDHYMSASAELWGLRDYVYRKIVGSSHYAKVAKKNLAVLDRMLFVHLAETLEVFLKEIAAVCVNHLATHILDDRFNVFSVNGSTVAAHFGAGTLGEALCESDTWLDCVSINKRFRHLLADPFDKKRGKFYLFPEQWGQGPQRELFRYPTLNLIWQLRHTIVHNAGLITKSDAVKLRLLARMSVDDGEKLTPTWDDLRYVKDFLGATATVANQRIGTRLAELSTTLHQENQSLFDPAEKASELAKDFQIETEVAGEQGTP